MASLTIHRIRTNVQNPRDPLCIKDLSGFAHDAGRKFFLNTLKARDDALVGILDFNLSRRPRQPYHLAIIELQRSIRRMDAVRMIGWLRSVPRMLVAANRLRLPQVHAIPIPGSRSPPQR